MSMGSGGGSKQGLHQFITYWATEPDSVRKERKRKERRGEERRGERRGWGEGRGGEGRGENKNKKPMALDMVAHACNLSTLGV